MMKDSDFNSRNNEEAADIAFSLAGGSATAEFEDQQQIEMEDQQD